MRLTLRARSLRFMALFPLILSLSQSIDVVVQTTSPCEEPSCEDSRFFQMALWTYDYLSGTNWESTVDYVDIPMFGSDIPSAQPPGRSIMRLESWDNAEPLSSVTVDWSRIVAVVIDEPYVTRLDEAGFTDRSYRASNPCSGSPLNAQRRAIVHDTRNRLMNAAGRVHDIAPRTRVWVNFAQYEVNWMRDTHCPQPLPLNDPTIDVVSLDKYEVNFSDIEDEYAWFISAMPQQQIALVPGTHYRVGGDSPQQAAARLQGYFDYANGMNQQCDIGLGRVGRTGNYDGCRVWIVAGWSAQPAFPVAAPEYYGSLHYTSTPISTAWLDQLSKIRRCRGPSGAGSPTSARC